MSGQTKSQFIQRMITGTGAWFLLWPDGDTRMETGPTKSKQPNETCFKAPAGGKDKNKKYDASGPAPAGIRTLPFENGARSSLHKILEVSTVPNYKASIMSNKWQEMGRPLHSHRVQSCAETI